MRVCVRAYSGECNFARACAYVRRILNMFRTDYGQDIAIFHSYWADVSIRIANVSAATNNSKPILVEEFGWPSAP